MTIAPLTFHKNAVGFSSWHRHWLKGQIDGRVSVPCGDCSVCCRSFDEIPLSEGDDFDAYLTRSSTRHQTPVLDKNADGSCVYLVDGRCSIYGRRPMTCRTFDCRVYYPFPVDTGESVRELIQAGRDRFEFVVKEPDDHTFTERYLSAMRELHADALEAGHGLLGLLQEALVHIAPERFRKHWR